MTFLTKLTSAAASLALMACTGADVDPAESPMPGEEARAPVDREMSPTLAEGELDVLVSGNTDFALDLYRELSGESGNLFFSPHSISTALVMTYAGARNATEEQMASALHFDLPPDDVHRAFNWLDLELDGRDDAVELEITNAAFAERSYAFLDEYLEVLARNYGAGVAQMDFVNDPDGSRAEINDWVAGRTEDRIPELIPEGVITGITRLVLANAIYFKATWESPFPEDNTTDGTFHAVSGDVTVPMMSGEVPASLVEGELFTTLSMPYKGDEVDMIVLLPHEGATVDAIAEVATAEVLAQVYDQLAPPQDVLVTMPKFEFRSQLALAEAMKGLGMRDAFDPAVADFSGMDGTTRLFVSSIVHEGYINVNEKGTEASAATAVILGEDSVPPSITVDRPFLFFVRDIPTGTVLFLGRVEDPSA